MTFLHILPEWLRPASNWRSMSNHVKLAAN